MNTLLKKIQVAQYKFARLMASRSLLDKILGDIKLLLVNQLNAQCKLLEVWKSINNKNHPKIWEIDPKIVDARTRSIQKESLIVVGKGLKLQLTFYSDAARLWNKAPDAIKNHYLVQRKKLNAGHCGPVV